MSICSTTRLQSKRRLGIAKISKNLDSNGTFHTGSLVPLIGNAIVENGNIMKEMVELEKAQNKVWLDVSKSRAAPAMANRVKQVKSKRFVNI